MSYYMLTEGTVTQAAAGLGHIPRAGAIQDGIFSGFGSLSAYRDGIFSGVGASGAVALDLTDKAMLEQFKLALRTMTNLSAADTDVHYWTAETEQAFNQWLNSMSTQPIDIKQLVTTRDGKNVPTALGAEWVIKTAIALYDPKDQAKSVAYAAKYWPALVAWNDAPVASRSYTPPGTEEPGKGMRYALIAGGVGIAAVGAYLLFKPKRRRD